jgi:hypothetical protein
VLTIALDGTMELQEDTLPAGFGLASHSKLSDDATKIWEWLVVSGIAHKIDDRIYGQVGEYETTY